MRRTTWQWIGTVAIIVAFVGLSSASAQLRDYVERPDPSYAYTLVSTTESGPVLLHTVQLTSQTWQGIVWQHWLTVIQPKDVPLADKALLFITGGKNGGEAPTISDGRDGMFLDVAVKTKSLVAILRQVPNQPLFDGMVEDQIIAYTFERFLKGEGDDWPLLLPMVKSAVRAMDTVQALAKVHLKQEINGFVVTGASKRGWTTWLTGATDARVVAIAPMVIDVLNMSVQMEQQLKSYGTYSEQIEDYSRRGIQDYQKTEEGKRLNAIVDPYAYRDTLTMPKLILLGTNDPYWTVDAANLYIHDLQGPTYLHYEANAGHGLGPGAYPALLAFYQAVLSGKPLPQARMESGPSGSIHLVYDDAPTINIWVARSVTRDFRQTKWEKYPVTELGGVISSLGFSEVGYAAYYVDFVYTNDAGVQYSLSSPMTVVPQGVFPFDATGAKIVRSEPEPAPAAAQAQADAEVVKTSRP